MNLQFRTNSKIQMGGSYQDQTKDKVRKAQGMFFLVIEKKFQTKNLEIFLLKASRNVVTLMTIYH